MTLDPFDKRAEDPRQSAAAIQGQFFTISAIHDGLIFVAAPPPVSGIGNAGGFRMMIEDRAGLGFQALQGVTYAMMGKAVRNLSAQVFSLFENTTPQLYLDIDRTKAQLLGINVPDVFAALQIYLGSAYVNDFNLFGRTFRVVAQARAENRADTVDALKIRVRNNNGETVPLGAFTTVRTVTGPYRVPRYNLYTAAELDGAGRPATARVRPSRSWSNWPLRRCRKDSLTSGRHWRFSKSGLVTHRPSPLSSQSCSCSWSWRLSLRA